MVSELVAAILIAIVQGVTEWFPVSSSGHLVLAEKILGFKGGLEFDVVLHLGTLAAVFVYFGKDIVDIARDLLTGNFESDNGKLGIYVLIATLPAVFVGYFFRSVFDFAFSDLFVVAGGFAVTGIVLIIASLPSSLIGGERSFGWKGALAVGIAQVFSLFPGVSRSGITVASGLLAGLDEKGSLKFSFLMSIPVILGANVFVVGGNTLPTDLIWATLVSFITGLVSIYLLYNFILNDKRNLRWFGFYALVLSALLFVLVTLLK